MATNPDSPAAHDELPSFAVRCVRALMERHGLPKYRQSAWLADATGLSYAQAHRRMSGAAAWTLEDLEQVAKLFGESLAEVVAMDTSHGSVPAVMKLGPASLPCELWIGEQIENPKPDTVVAVKTSSGWAALYASEAADNSTFAVERLQAKPSAAQRKVIAVFGDDGETVAAICTHLEDKGYDARPFANLADIQSSLRPTGRYDAFVIDWMVGGTPTRELIASIRAQDTNCPIVLTAQLTDPTREAEVAEAVTKFSLVFTEKPVRMAILSALLVRAFAVH